MSAAAISRPPNQQVNSYDEQEFGAYSQRSQTRPRPTPKPNQYDEIIQDGLGNDELIPSEWATGSRARFLTASRAHDRERASPSPVYHSSMRAASDANAYSRSWADETQDRGKEAWTGNGEDATAYPEQNSLDVLADSLLPTTNREVDQVAQARDRARKLARQRAQLNRGEDSLQSDSLQQHSSEAIGRAASSPMLRSKDPAYSQDQPYTPERGAQAGSMRGASQKPALRHAPSKNSLNDRSRPMTPSRIPLPTSGSMDKYATNGVRSRGADATRRPSAVDRDGTDASPAHPDGQDSRLSARHNASRTPTPIKNAQAKQPGSRKTSGAMQNSPPTQDVLDQFGPLGGTPKKTLVQKEQEAGLDMNEFGGLSASPSNPWDEELLPTVKRRLAQQAMLQTDRGGDDLIDTWDRDGMPLSTKSVTPRKASQVGGGDVGQELDEDGQPSQQPNSQTLNEKNTQDKLRVGASIPNPTGQTSQEQRFKRLTDQLDFGLRNQNGPAESSAHEAKVGWNDGSQHDPSRASAGAIEMDSMKQKRRKSRYEATAAHPSSSGGKQTGNGAQSGSAADYEDAGCCKCTIM